LVVPLFPPQFAKFSTNLEKKRREKVRFDELHKVALFTESHSKLAAIVIHIPAA